MFLSLWQGVGRWSHPLGMWGIFKTAWSGVCASTSLTVVINLLIYLCQDLSFISDAIQSIHLYCAFAWCIQDPVYFPERRCSVFCWTLLICIGVLVDHSAYLEFLGLLFLGWVSYLYLVYDNIAKWLANLLLASHKCMFSRIGWSSNSTFSKHLDI